MVKKLILVVEDNTIVALDISRRLKRLGYNVIPYPIISGEAAIEKAERLHPDLVLMDIKLKGKIDGIQAAEIIGNRFNIPVIYITAHSDKRTRQRAMRTNPLGYLLKPFEDTKLQETILKVLNPKEQNQSSIPPPGGFLPEQRFGQANKPTKTAIELAAM